MARNVVLRTTVLERLDEARRQLVTVVCAPAGYGKSLAVASWLRDRQITAAWVSLDARFNDPVNLWAAVARDLARTLPSSSAEFARIRDFITHIPAEAPSAIATWLASRNDEVVLVLDDLHLVSNDELHSQLLELIGSAGPHLHVLAITRHDPPWPLHRMRLDGILDELTVDQIRFDDDAAAELFGMLGICVSQADVRALVRRTEGWAAGLRLAALGMREAADPHAYAESLSGHAGYIAEYLLHEVYEQVPPSWRDFLDRVCVVDEVCADLATALGCGPDSADLLAQMQHVNAFVDEIGSAGWYRLHPLLLDFLRSRISVRGTRRTQHIRASAWFRRHGEPLTALRHSVAAEEWSTAGELVGRHVVTWTVRRSPTALLTLLEPVPQEAVLVEPELAVGLAAARTMAGISGGVTELVAASRSRMPRLPATRRRRLDFLIELIHIGTRRWSSDLEALLDGCRRLPKSPGALSELGLSDWASLRTLLLSNQGTCELWLGDYHTAAATLHDAAAEDPGSRVVLPILNAQAHTALLHWACGDLTVAGQTAERVVERFGRGGLARAAQAAGAYLTLAGVAFDRDERDSAARWLDLAESSSVEPHMSLPIAVLRARLNLADGLVADALTAIGDAMPAAPSAATAPAPINAAADYFRSLLAEEGPSPAPARNHALEQLPAAPPGSLRRCLFACLQRIDDPRVEHNLRLESLEEALGLAAAENLRRPFLDRAAPIRRLLAERIERGTRHPQFAHDLLTRTPDRSSRRADPDQGFFVPLSSRETNVLQYLIGSMTTAEIAEALYVSVNTVKTHQRSIYQKLGATGRREAVARARHLGLL